MVGLPAPQGLRDSHTTWTSFWGAHQQRYHNEYWPSIYVFDKKGIARWGWAGELTWGGAKGDVHMRKKIEELLRE
jgi:hypothetical protein